MKFCQNLHFPTFVIFVAQISNKHFCKLDEILRNFPSRGMKELACFVPLFSVLFPIILASFWDGMIRKTKTLKWFSI